MELPPRNCPSCGALNLATAIYCVSCRAILPAIAVPHGVMGTVRKPKADRSWMRRLGRALVNLLFVAMALLVGLAVWPARSDMLIHPTPGSAPGLDQIMRRSVDAGGDRLVYAHEVANALMVSATDTLLHSIALKFGEGTVLLRLGYSWKGIPWTIAVAYHLEGGAGTWRLVPVSGSLGHLPLGGGTAGAMAAGLLSRNPSFLSALAWISSRPALRISGHALHY